MSTSSNLNTLSRNRNNNNNVEAVDEENNATLSSMVGRLKKVEPTVNERFLLRTKEALKKTIAKFEKDVERETNAIQTKQQGVESLHYQAILQHAVNAKNAKCYFYLLCFFWCYFFFASLFIFVYLAIEHSPRRPANHRYR